MSIITENKIVKAGTYNKWGTDVSISEDNLDEMVRNFEDVTASTRKLPVNVGHRDEEVPAVGWIMALKKVIDATGAWLVAKIQWTNESWVEDVKENESYKYVSIEAYPETVHPSTGENVGFSLDGLAVTNKPFIRELPELQFDSAEPEGDHGIKKEKGSSKIYLTEETKIFSDLMKEIKLSKSQKEEKEQNKMSKAEKEKKDVNKAIKLEDGAPEGTETVEVKSTETGEVEEVSAILAGLREVLKLPEASVEDALKAVADLMAAGGKKSEEEVQMESEEDSMASEDSSEEEEEEDDKKEDEVEVEASKTKFDKKDMSVLLSLERNKVKTLTEKLAKFEEKEIVEKVSSLIGLGKIPAGKKDFFIKLAKKDRESFDEYIGETSVANPVGTALNKSTSVISNKSVVKSDKKVEMSAEVKAIVELEKQKLSREGWIKK